jgi:tetratricopeptide (TPR) repeat protein
MAFEILCARQRFGDALALADQAKNDPTLEILRARTLYLLGEKDKALPVLDRFAAEIKAGKTSPWHEDLVRAEYNTALREQAFDNCARLLTSTKAEGNQARLLGLVFPRDADRAEVWWKVLRQRFPAEDPPMVMKRVRDIVDGRTTGKDLEALLGGAEELTAKQEPANREEWLLVLADTCRAARLEPAAGGYLEKAAALPGFHPQALIRQGDFLAGKGLWEQAAERYGLAWEHRRQPLSLYLKGWAQTQAGAAAEGRKLMDLAHWVPLGNDYQRQEFADALAKRGWDADAQRERELLFRTSGPASFAAGEALRDVAVGAMAHKDYLKAADCQERALLRCFQPNTGFVEDQAYVVVPHYIHRLRARGLVAAGRLDEGRRELAVCEALRPGNLDLPLQLVPELEKRGLKKDADGLFERALDAGRRLCTDYPRSAWAHNNLAWLCARCRRNLDDGLEHASKAVELSPDKAASLDTLAEVYFQRGDQGKAIELMKKCITLEPGSTYFPRQLKRLEAGDRSSDLPSGGDED